MTTHRGSGPTGLRARQRQRAGRPHRRPAPPPHPLRRPAAAPPLPLDALPALPGGLAPPLPARRTRRTQRRDVPRQPRRRHPHPLLPPAARTPRSPRPRPAARRLPRPLVRTARSRGASARHQPGADLDEQTAFQIGLDALALTVAELIPKLGRHVAVQRRLEYTLAPGLEWTIQCHLDLETLRDDGEQTVPAVVDYKVKSTPLTAAKADHDPRPGCISPGAGSKPTRRASSASPRSPSPAPSASRSAPRSSPPPAPPGSYACILARIAQAASQICALHDRYGPERPWGFADPSGWKCSPHYCSHHARCPGGAGL
jgi:hypothetical protein